MGGSFIMNIKEKYKMQEIINNYLDWFKASTIITPIESADKETVKVSTMFLDSHNDGIEFYIQKIDDNYIALTDDGWYLQDLESCGLDLNSSRITEQINWYRNFLNFDIVKGEILSVVRLDENVPLKIHAYIQALILITALD